MTSEIKCKVSDCDYWENMKCAADQVEVNMENRGSEICSPDATYCETFKTRKC